MEGAKKEHQPRLGLSQRSWRKLSGWNVWVGLGLGWAIREMKT